LLGYLATSCNIRPQKTQLPLLRDGTYLPIHCLAMNTTVVTRLSGKMFTGSLPSNGAIRHNIDSAICGGISVTIRNLKQSGWLDSTVQLNTNLIKS
jgi:hypothetical protein